MDIFFIATNTIEPWDYTNPDGPGIGGSETSQIELAWRLARRGHKVTSYAPVPWGGVRENRGVTWTHFDNADYSQPGLWMVYRNPEVVDRFPEPHPDQILIHVNQDTLYPSESTERYEKFDRVMCLCRDHREYVEVRWPVTKGKIFLSGNGIRGDLIDEVLQENIPRNPRKVVFTSSPDRGIKNAAVVVDRAREYIQDLELHTYYGLDNYKTMAQLKGDSMKARATAYFSKRGAEDIENFMARYPWVVQHGRVPQKELYRELASAGVHLYPTSFTETGCISVMESMALGAVPISNPIWAIRDNVTHGVLVEGNPDRDLLVRARYAMELTRVTSDTGMVLQEQIRPQMMAEAWRRFDWEVRTTELEGLVASMAEQSQEAIACS